MSRKPEKAPKVDYLAGVTLRIDAEDSVYPLPQPGWVREMTELKEWKYPGALAEFIPEVLEREDIAPTGRGLLGLLHVVARDGLQAFHVASEVLKEIWIAGTVHSNDEFLHQILNHAWVKEGIFHAGFVDQEFLPETQPSGEWVKAAAAVCGETISQAERSHAIWRVGAQSFSQALPAIDWVHAPEIFFHGSRKGISGLLRLGAAAEECRVCATPMGEDRWRVHLGRWTQMVRIRKKDFSGGPMLHALASGRMHSLLFRENIVVANDEPLCLLDSCRELVAHRVGKKVQIKKWLVQNGQTVEQGQPLAELEIV